MQLFAIAARGVLGAGCLQNPLSTKILFLLINPQIPVLGPHSHSTGSEALGKIFFPFICWNSEFLSKTRCRRGRRKELGTIGFSSTVWEDGFDLSATQLGDLEQALGLCFLGSSAKCLCLFPLQTHCENNRPVVAIVVGRETRAGLC